MEQRQCILNWMENTTAATEDAFFLCDVLTLPTAIYLGPYICITSVLAPPSKCPHIILPSLCIVEVVNLMSGAQRINPSRAIRIKNYRP